MIIKLNLTSLEYISHHAVVTVPEDSVMLDISSATYATDAIVITARKNGKDKQFRYKGESIDLTELCTSAGCVEMSASLAYRGEVVKVWQIEPLIIKEIPSGILAVSEIEELKSRLKICESAIKELYGLIVN